MKFKKATQSIDLIKKLNETSFNMHSPLLKHTHAIKKKYNQNTLDVLLELEKTKRHVSLSLCSVVMRQTSVLVQFQFARNMTSKRYVHLL